MGRGTSQSPGWSGGPRTPHTIEIQVHTKEDRELWSKALELAEAFGPDEAWSLVGGLMVQLHAFEHGATQRPTQDIDVLGDDRAGHRMTERIAEILEKLRAHPDPPSLLTPKRGYRFTLEDGHTVDVLGPDGLKTPAKTLEGRETLGIPGGTQALRRTEKVNVSLEGGGATVVRRPDLLGAILIKARGLMDRAHNQPEKIESDRRDLILLLSFADDPRAMRPKMKLTERGWLRRAAKRLQIDEAGLEQVFSAAALANARAAYDLMT